MFFKVFSAIMGLAMSIVSMCLLAQINVAVSHMGLAAIDPASSVLCGIAELICSAACGLLVFHAQMDAFKEGGYLA